MRIMVTGSIATNHLMTFAGSISAQFLPSAVDRLSLSFLVDDLQVRSGGVAANIAIGMARLGVPPILAASVGVDFGDYAARLAAAGVSTEFLHHSATRHTARFLCTTDRHGNQIASFYPGAMAEARDIPLPAVIERVGADLVVVSPNDPEAMVRHTADCRRAGVPFAADPSQQIALLDGAHLRRLIDGARYLFVNDYELALLYDKTDLTDLDLLDRVGTVITTHGADGVSVTTTDRTTSVAAVPAVVVDPTGGGDAFRAGLLAALSRGLPVEAGARLGCALASIVLEAVGPQEYEASPGELHRRLAGAYGLSVAGEVLDALSVPALR